MKQSGTALFKALALFSLLIPFNAGAQTVPTLPPGDGNEAWEFNSGAQVLEEVVVAVQKRGQNIQDVGIAIMTFSTEQPDYSVVEGAERNTGRIRSKWQNDGMFSWPSIGELSFTPAPGCPVCPPPPYCPLPVCPKPCPAPPPPACWKCPTPWVGMQGLLGFQHPDPGWREPSQEAKSAIEEMILFSGGPAWAQPAPWLQGPNSLLQGPNYLFR